MLGGILLLFRHPQTPPVQTTVTIDGASLQTSAPSDPAKVLPPKWVPSYPAAQDLENHTRQDTKDTISGTFRTRTRDTPEKVKDYFASTLKADGFETETTTTEANGSDVTVVTAATAGGKRKIKIQAEVEKGTTNIAISYQGPK